MILYLCEEACDAPTNSRSSTSTCSQSPSCGTGSESVYFIYLVCLGVILLSKSWQACLGRGVQPQQAQCVRLLGSWCGPWVSSHVKVLSVSSSFFSGAEEQELEPGEAARLESQDSTCFEFEFSCAPSIGLECSTQLFTSFY